MIEKDKTLKICPNCGKAFMGSKRRRFCNNFCASQFWNRKYRGYEHKPLGKTVCTTCGKIFQKKSANHKFCSESCRVKMQKMRRIKAKLKMKACTCLWCGKEFNCNRFRSFCSSECRRKFTNIRNRIFNLYTFNHRAIQRELAKLRREGGNYRFSKPNEGLNDLYRLELLEKAKLRN